LIFACFFCQSDDHLVIGILANDPLLVIVLPQYDHGELIHLYPFFSGTVIKVRLASFHRYDTDRAEFWSAQ